MHTSTYRIQFNHSFPFSKLEKYAGYLEKLGITTLYASPILQSTPGSMHGYDVTDPLGIDPELGGETGFNSLHKLLRKHQIGWLQDIVPNHMAFNHHNRWLWDVLENGRESEFAPVFDIDWEHPEFPGKLMVPFLGKSFDEAVRDAEIHVVFDAGGFHFKYFETLYPLNQEGFIRICGEDFPEALSPFLDHLKPGADGTKEDWRKLKEGTENLYKESSAVKSWIDQRLAALNEDKEKLKSLHDLQYYSLVYWKMTEDTINYRRFFTVNGLICLRMEDQQVFDRYHALLKDLIGQEKFMGLRIDHIDGLRDPGEYLDRLRGLAGKNSYFLIEKILELREDLPENLNVQGTTGYEFLAMVNNLFTHEKQYPVLADFYDTILPDKQDLEAVIHQKKQFILYERMAGELDNLCRELYSSGLIPEIMLRETEPAGMRKALAAFLIAFPVYRLYVNRIPPSENDSIFLRNIIESAIAREPALEQELSIIFDLFMGNFGHSVEGNDRVLQFFKRCMQFTGPLMAKGVEDTTMYYFHRFIAHNEVGDEPGAHGFTIEEFHRAMILRQEKWPLAMNATSTHDTKRGEDTRARLNVISDLAETWKKWVIKWFEMNASAKKTVNGKIVPTRNEEYLIYQTLAGIWPFEKHPDESLKERLRDYFIKAMREAKTHTTWNDPAEDHESTVIGFLDGLLDQQNEFYHSFDEFIKKISRFGILNSLAQLILKMTCPGIPDIYRGCEMWDFTLVDPDNRRPVDFDHRINRLETLIHDKNIEGFTGRMIRELYSGDIKLWFTHMLLSLRKSDPDLFLRGEYIPFEVNGTYKEYFLSYARKQGSRWLIVVIPLHLAAIHKDWHEIMNQKMDWAGTELVIPEMFTGPCLEILSGRKMSPGSSLSLNEMFVEFPMAVLGSI